MVHSASQLVAGWNRAGKICLILLLHGNVLNSSLIKQEPLSVTRTSRMPNWTNNVQESSMTLVEVAESVGNASIHLEWESITARIILPLNGLVKTKWSLTQGRDGHFHGWSGAMGGAACCC